MKIKVDTQEWEVRLIPGDEELESANWGRSNSTQKTITLDIGPGRSERDIEETLLHELIHVALGRIGRKEESENEPLIKGLSIKLYDILKANGFLANIYPKLKEKNAKER